MKGGDFSDLSLLLDAVTHPVFVHDSKFKVIYANKAYIQAAKKPYKDILHHVYWSSFPKQRKFTVGCVKALETNQPVSEEVEIKKGVFFLIRSFPVFINKKYQYSVHILEDITEKKRIWDKLQAEKESLKHRVAFERLVQKINVELNGVSNIDQNIYRVIKLLGKFVKVDCCHIFKYDSEQDVITDKYSYRAAMRTKSCSSQTQNMPFEKTFPWLAKKVKNFQIVRVEKESDLPAKAHKFKQLLHQESIQSTLVTPIFYSDNLLGFIRFDSIKKPETWHDGDIELLATVSKLLAHAFLQEENIQKERDYHQYFEDMLLETIKAVMQMTEQRDPYTAGHQMRVADLAMAIAIKMGLTEEEIKGIYLGGLIHDIGKIHIPAEILSTPKPLTREEFTLIKMHPQAGYDIVKDIPFIWPIKNIILQHHERLDGSGYPKGLKGEKISLEARIVAVADVYEAMSSHRPYRPKKSKKEVHLELTQNAGKLYDKRVVDCCLALIKSRRFRFTKPALTTEFFK